MGNHEHFFTFPVDFVCVYVLYLHKVSVFEQYHIPGLLLPAAVAPVRSVASRCRRRGYSPNWRNSHPNGTGNFPVIFAHSSHTEFFSNVLCFSYIYTIWAHKQNWILIYLLITFALLLLLMVLHLKRAKELPHFQFTFIHFNSLVFTYIHLFI